MQARSWIALPIRQRRLSHAHDIVSLGKFRFVESEGFAQSASDAVALHGATDSLADAQAQSRPGQVIG